MRKLTRRRFVADASALTALTLPLPAWVGASPTRPEVIDNYQLTIGDAPLEVAGRTATATGINGTVPGPLLRFTEGHTAILDVSNALEESTSIHWHGLLLPTGMDGVPGLSFDGIDPGETFRYEFELRQTGTYWYHSHSGLQEQTGIYGPLIIDPAGTDPVALRPGVRRATVRLVI